MIKDITELGALVMVAVALGSVTYLGITGNEAAQGALISVVSAGVGYFLRGRVVAPSV